jgi:hypothetical protein
VDNSPCGGLTSTDMAKLYDETVPSVRTLIGNNRRVPCFLYRSRVLSFLILTDKDVVLGQLSKAKNQALCLVSDLRFALIKIQEQMLCFG